MDSTKKRKKKEKREKQNAGEPIRTTKLNHSLFLNAIKRDFIKDAVIMANSNRYILFKFSIDI